MQKVCGKKLHILNWCRFLLRTFLFVGAATLYIIGKANGWQHTFGGLEFNKTILMLIWIMFAFEFVAKLVPNKTERRYLGGLNGGRVIPFALCVHLYSRYVIIAMMEKHHDNEKESPYAY